VTTLFWSYLIWNLGYALYVTLLTLYLQSLGLELTTVGLIVGGAAIGRMLLAVPAGTLVDRTSPGPVLLATMVLPVAGVMVLVAANAWWMALAGSLLVELSGLGIPALSAWLAGLASSEGRTRAYQWVYTVGPQVANLLGPALAGLIAATVGYRPVFAVAAGAFGAGAALVGPMVLRSRRRPAATPAAGSPDVSDETSASPEPIPIGVMLRRPGIRLVILLHVLVPLLPYAGFVLSGNLLVDARGLDVAVYGLLGSLASGVGLVAAVVSGRVRWLRDPFAGLAACLFAGALALVLLLPDAGLALLVVVYVFRGLLSPVWSYLSAAVADVTPERARGRVFGLAEAGAGVGDVGAPLVAGRLYAADPVLPAVFGAVTTLPLALVLAFARRRRGVVASPDYP
jgi:MFS family permease